MYYDDDYDAATEGLSGSDRSFAERMGIMRARAKNSMEISKSHQKSSEYMKKRKFDSDARDEFNKISQTAYETERDRIKEEKNMKSKANEDYSDFDALVDEQLAMESDDYSEFDRLVDEQIAMESQDDDDTDDIDLDDYDDSFDDDIVLEGDDDFSSDDLDASTESLMFLDFIAASCESAEEFVDLVTENAVEWALYGLIDDADEAIEATKVMRVEDWKNVNRHRLVRRECIRLAKKDNTDDYKKYAKYRMLMRQYRDKLFKRYEAKAKANVKRAQSNAASKSSNIKTASGKDTNKRIVKTMATPSDTKRINSQVSKSEKGKGPATTNRTHTNRTPA